MVWLGDISLGVLSIKVAHKVVKSPKTTQGVKVDRKEKSKA